MDAFLLVRRFLIMPNVFLSLLSEVRVSLLQANLSFVFITNYCRMSASRRGLVANFPDGRKSSPDVTVLTFAKIRN